MYNSKTSACLQYASILVFRDPRSLSHLSSVVLLLLVEQQVNSSLEFYSSCLSPRDISVPFLFIKNLIPYLICVSKDSQIVLVSAE